jgi:hypothetical protein
MSYETWTEAMAAEESLFGERPLEAGWSAEQPSPGDGSAELESPFGEAEEARTGPRAGSFEALGAFGATGYESPWQEGVDPAAEAEGAAGGWSEDGAPGGAAGALEAQLLGDPGFEGEAGSGGPDPELLLEDGEDAGARWAEVVAEGGEPEAEERHDGGASGLSELERELLAEQFSGPEHRGLGTSAGGGRATVVSYAPGRTLTFGEVVMLAGDYFESYDEMAQLSRTAAGRQQLAWARWDAADGGPGEPAVPAAAKKAAKDRYFALAGRNVSHFSAGGTGWSTYTTWHSRALASAFSAGQSGSDQTWRIATTKEAFAQHFLTDIFSAGHIRMPRIELRDWYAKNMPDSLAKIVNYMARFMFDRLDKGGQLPTLAWWALWLTKSPLEDRVMRLGGEAVRTFSIGDIVGLALHDFDNKGLRVVSSVDHHGKPVAGGLRWTAVGDARLQIVGSPAQGTLGAGARTKAMAIAAAKASLAELDRVRDAGRRNPRVSGGAAQADLVKKAVGAPVFAAKAFVPREDRGNPANATLPPVASGRAALEWRWGQLGPAAYREVDVTIRQRIASELFGLRKLIDDPVDSPVGKIHGTRRAFLQFAEHLRNDGITVLETAVGKKAR